MLSNSLSLPVSEHAAGDEPLALYVHWPFCVSKCPYCDFNSHVRAEVDMEAWQKALLADLAHEAALLPGRRLASIFFGGGTPSLMPPGIAGALIDAACRYWTPADDIEITLEANPSSVEARKFAAFAKAGVNRVSLGLQALDDDALRFLGRAHNVREGLAALEVAQANFARVSFDLIYARPGQTLAAWQKELQQALSFGTGHLSLYQLTIEQGTRFATLYNRGELQMPDEDTAADLFSITQDIANAAGLPAYEVSNHARAGAESRHNLVYWRYGDYAGIGPGAHGRRLNMATTRHKKPENWLQAVANCGHGINEETPLSSGERAREAMLMGLRLVEGISLSALEQKIGAPAGNIISSHARDRLIHHKLLQDRPDRLAVTPAGMLVLNAIIAELVII